MGTTSTVQQGENALEGLKHEFMAVREHSHNLVEPLEIEDFCMQSHPAASPVNWHISHTTWFFETFLLKPFLSGYKVFDDKFSFLFNSYYNTVGERIEQRNRHKLSRPTVKEILAYRNYVDENMHKLLETKKNIDEIKRRVHIGMNHEQQHQELILTDFKHYLGTHFLQPAYKEINYEKHPAPQSEFVGFDYGVVDIGHFGDDFCYDNEQPLHKVYLQPYQIQNRLVTNGEFIEFIEDGGYERHQYWLSDGWMHVQDKKWSCPLYWKKINDQWMTFTLGGLKEVDLDEPVCHVSFFEADAYARWKGARLATEFEWEHAANQCKDQIQTGNFVEEGIYHPRAPKKTETLMQMFGDVWEWTVSAYAPYPGYYPEEGAIGEYNGKFMNNQRVLKGGSCATPRSHIRSTYRNFWAPETRWQFSGFRLAKEL